MRFVGARAVNGETRRVRERFKGRRWLLLVLGATLVAGIALAAFLTRDGGGPLIADRSAADRLPAVMEVRVTLSTDDAEPVEVWRDRVSFSVGERPLPTMEADLDLTPWAGKLVRFDIEGEVVHADRPAVRLGHVGCSAQVVDRSGTRYLEFVGWHNEGDSPVHAGSIGPRSALHRQDARSAFWYATEGPLWHVLEAAAGSALRLQVRPLPAQELQSEPVGLDAGHPAAADRTESLRLGRMRSGSGRHPDVFIYLIDALRADHLGCYGYDRNTSPNIDGFASDSVVFENAYTTATWTRPAVASLLTGLYPSSHGVLTALDRLGDWVVLLPEALAESGYRSYCVANNPHIGEAWGFNQGYDRFARETLQSASWVNAHLADFLAGEKPDQPVFVYVHTLEPHGPYAPTAGARRSFDRGGISICDGSSWEVLVANRTYPWLSEADIDHLVDLYDAEIFDSDRAFGNFLELLEEAGRLQNSLVVLVADHGEAFNEHDALMHGCTLNREEMHVPLIIRFPRGESGGLRVKQSVGLVDVFPTVLARTGTESGPGYVIPGMDLSVALAQPGAERRLYAELSHPPEYALDLLAVIDEDGYKSVIEMLPRRMTVKDAIGLWDTKADPDECIDLNALLPVRGSYHEQLLAHWLVAQGTVPAAARPPAVEMTDEMRRSLRALGYLH